MAQGTFVQALRKEAALSGTFMKGRSLMLNGAVLSIALLQKRDGRGHGARLAR